MARKGEEGELPSVAELLNLSQTKPLMIRGELDAKLAAEAAAEPAEEPEPKLDPLAVLEAELAADDPDDERPLAAPPVDRSRRAYPYVLGAGAAVALGLAAVVFLQPHEVGGTAVPPPSPPPSSAAPVPTSREAVATMSASPVPPTLTAGLQDTPVRTTNTPAAAGRKPAGSPASSASPQDQWRDMVSSAISSWQHGHGRPGR
jgi:hypothetical protein